MSRFKVEAIIGYEYDDDAPMPQFVSIAPDGVAEYYLDHTLLSSFRMCESSFVLDFIENYRLKGLPPWALHFGSLFHECLEWFYRAEMSGDYSDIGEFTKNWLMFSMDLWRKYNMDSFSQLPQYKALNGQKGFMCLLGQYVEYYRNNFTNKLKPVALEIAFGRNKEVPLLDSATEIRWAPFRLYYSGRMDYIFDDGRRLGPLDHKTFSRMDKNPITGYEVQEGMTGYVYAMGAVYKQLKEKLMLNEFNKLPEHANVSKYDRLTDVVWMNFIGVPNETDLLKRFQRIPIYKTPSQLEEWRLRQISTTAKLHQVLFEGRPSDFNAGVCTNWFHNVCKYHQVHRQASVGDQLIILNNNFTKENAEWNPESERSGKI